MAVTLRETFTIDGILTDVTSVALSDPTGTFGVKRNDTGATVVADGTAMTKVGTGTYEYAFAEPEPNLTYTYWVEWVYSGETYHDEHTVVGTVTLPVSLAEAKVHLRITHDDDDAYILNVIKAATNLAEIFQQRTYVQRQRIYILDDFPAVIIIPYPPLIQVDSIQYTDTDGVLQTLAPSQYQVDIKNEPGRIVPAYGESWPSTRGILDAITVTYIAGYGTADDVPAEIKQAVLLIIGHLYENRENVTDARLARIPDGAERLLWPGRILYRCDQAN